MEFMPEIETVAKIAQEGVYKVVPVSTSILSDIRTPMEVLKILKNNSDHTYILESASESEKSVSSL